MTMMEEWHGFGLDLLNEKALKGVEFFMTSGTGTLLKTVAIK